MSKDQEKAERQIVKAENEFRKAEDRIGKKQWKKYLKCVLPRLYPFDSDWLVWGRQQETMLKLQRRHPNRLLPIPSEPVPPAYTATPGETKDHTLPWSLLPTPEAYGFRRPLEAQSLAHWPAMSQTMHHVSVTCLSTEWKSS